MKDVFYKGFISPTFVSEIFIFYSDFYSFQLEDHLIQNLKEFVYEPSCNKNCVDVIEKVLLRIVLKIYRFKMFIDLDQFQHVYRSFKIEHIQEPSNKITRMFAYLNSTSHVNISLLLANAQHFRITNMCQIMKLCQLKIIGSGSLRC